VECFRARAPPPPPRPSPSLHAPHPCSYLMYAGLASSADEALAMFGAKRTVNGKGVTLPRCVCCGPARLPCPRPRIVYTRTHNDALKLAHADDARP
jgi:hypothetical protein